MSRNICIGSRESRLAVVQTELVMNYIRENHPEIQVSMLTMKTTGDIILDKTLDKIGGKGLFVKELDKALLLGKSDLSVHSLKDMPMEIDERLPLVAFGHREDPRDVLVYPQNGVMKKELPIGCSSARRMLQLKELMPDVRFQTIRGNVITRLRKLDDGEYGALILAAAGLKRLGLEGRISRYFEPEEMIPAAGQGILAIQGRAGEDYGFMKAFSDPEAEVCALAERAFVRMLDGGCSSPVAAHARVSGSQIQLDGLYYDEESKVCLKGTLRGCREEAEQIGEELAVQLKEQAKGK